MKSAPKTKQLYIYSICSASNVTALDIKDFHSKLKSLLFNKSMIHPLTSDSLAISTLNTIHHSRLTDCLSVCLTLWSLTPGQKILRCLSAYMNNVGVLIIYEYLLYMCM